MPILVVADRAGATLSQTLHSLNARSVMEALEPVVARDALLVFDANGCDGPVIEKRHTVPGGIHACGKNWGKIVKNLLQPEKMPP